MMLAPMWWSDEQLAQLTRTVGDALTRWRLEWLVPGSLFDLETAGHAHECPEAIDMAWAPLGCRESVAAHAWVACSSDSADSLCAAMFDGSAPRGSIARAVAAQAWNDLLQELRQALQLDAAHMGAPAPAACAFKPWHGAVVLCLSTRLAMFLMFDGPCAQSLLNTSTSADRGASSAAEDPPLSTLPEALDAKRVLLRVEARSVELTLAALQDLHVGDVIPLAHPLHQPLEVKDAQSVVLCSAYLGRHGQRKAIELAALAPATATAISH